MKKLWKCSVCNYVHQGEEAPDKCPKCGVEKEKFAELSSEDSEKIYASDRTNDIHMKIVELCSKIALLCQEGEKINLDPPCVSAFEKAKNEVWIIKQRSKAEMEGHVKKGKW